MNTKKIERKNLTLDSTDVLKHLKCIICQDIFDEPNRLTCG